MKIRRATVDDALELARVHADSWRAAYLDRFEYDWRERCFREALDRGVEETYLVRSGVQVVGFLTLGAARDPDLDAERTGEIWGIYVSPDAWRRGIGRALEGKAERILRSRGYEDAVLWVLEGNARARRFYEAMGFAPDGESREMDWGAPLRAVRYAKHLGLAGASVS
jgi:ribosomal protein S18 acetylase RimI-like enzyme